MKWTLKRSVPEKENWNARNMFGPKLGFAQQEAYKLLRSNLTFSFADEGKCHLLGITSAIQDEGKSSTACNVAYFFSEAGFRVLLLEADMRRPTIAKKLNIESAPGLSNLLVKKEDFREYIQRCAQAPRMDVLTSGYIPPNPSELLCSKRMEDLLSELSANYDYIILDMPPVTPVSDVIVLSPQLDGVVMVVRGGYSDQRLLDETLRQLKMANLRVLGFAYRNMETTEQSYRYRYYRKYYKKGYGYK